MSAVVVRLPTAAERKVKQPWTRARCNAKALLPQFPRNHHRTPAERKALERAAIIKQIERSPALVIITAMFRQLDEMAQLQIIGLCGMSAATSGRMEAMQAVEWLDAHRKGRTVGDNAFMEWAFRQLEEAE